MKLSWIGAAMLIAGAASGLTAQELPAVAVAVRLTHVEQDSWRVDYTFAQPVTALRMEAVDDYRPTAWNILTPGVRLSTDDATHQDVLAAGGKPFQSLSVAFRTFDTLLPKQYIAVDRFTDGGRIVYLGFLQGEVQQSGTAHTIAPRFTLVGLGAETTILPPAPVAQSLTDHAYAYFGPLRPVEAGGASVIIDPATPSWVRETLLETTAKMSAHYAAAYRRTLQQPLVILAALADTQAPGLSIKGGAIGGQIAYRLSGKELLTDHPKKRELVAALVAHEMAHIWQQNVARGGVGSDAPWIHEGGAEAMALEGLVTTGLWSAASGDAYVAKTVKKCEQAGHSFDTYDGIYACGFERFYQLGVPTVPLWRALIARTESSGAPYSEAMIESIAKEYGRKDAGTR